MSNLSFTPEDIRGRPVDLIKLCRDRPIASDSHIVIGLPGVLSIGIGLVLLLCVRHRQE